MSRNNRPTNPDHKCLLGFNCSLLLRLDELDLL
jgi:hypothetical protein